MCRHSSTKSFSVTPQRCGDAELCESVFVLPKGGRPDARGAEKLGHILGTYLHPPRIWDTVPEGIMQKSKAEKLRRLASKRQIARAKDAKELGIPRSRSMSATATSCSRASFRDFLLHSLRFEFIRLDKTRTAHSANR